MDGCRKPYVATPADKSSYGWELYEKKDFIQSKEWFYNSTITAETWKDGYNGLGWSYANLLELDSLDTENIGSIRTFHRGLTYPYPNNQILYYDTPWQKTEKDVHLDILAGLTFAYHAKGNNSESVKHGNALLDSTLIGLNPSRWVNWEFSHDSTLNYLDLRLTIASSYFALAKFDSTHKHLKVVLDSLGSPNLLINDYSTLLGKQKVAQQLDSLQKVLQQK
tara:strand:- start:48 stop:713 length:666 start_codon:yes stop_codon:yes gene_type:complete